MLYWKTKEGHLQNKFKIEQKQEKKYIKKNLLIIHKKSLYMHGL